MKRFSSLIKGKSARASPGDNNAGDTRPEASIVRAIKDFCAQSPANAGDEVVHLPLIVDAAESSPAAASAAARQIRDFLAVPTYFRGHKDAPQPHVQYNAIMLIRILVDNPGQAFTRNFDSKFVAAVKNVLRNHWDPSVQTLMRETLGSFEAKSESDPNLKALMTMWNKERKPVENSHYSQQMMAQTLAMSRVQTGGPYAPAADRAPAALPPPQELQARVEEAKTSAQLLIQLCSNTLPEELRNNDLVKEFADRCTAAQRSMQAYMSLNPDPDTFQTLIETSEQLNVAQSRYHRALLASHRGSSNGSEPTLTTAGGNAASPPAATNGKAPAVGVAEADPFSDDNQVAEPVLRARNPYAANKVPVLAQPQPPAKHKTPADYAADLAGLKLDGPEYPLTATGFPPAKGSASSGAPAVNFTTNTGLPAAETAQRAEREVEKGNFVPPAGPPPAKTQQTDDDDDLYGSGSPAVGRVKDV